MNRRFGCKDVEVFRADDLINVMCQERDSCLLVQHCVLCDFCSWRSLDTVIFGLFCNDDCRERLMESGWWYGCTAYPAQPNNPAELGRI